MHATSPRSAFPARPFAKGVFALRLRGRIGHDAPFSKDAVIEQIAQNSGFSHLHIEIHDCPGGSADEGLSIYEALRALPFPVSTAAVGRCQSAGLFVLLAGALRFATRDAQLLLHPIRTYAESMPEALTAPVLFQKATELAALDDRIANIFATRTQHPRSWFVEEQRTETLLEPIDAVVTGTIHDFESFTPAIDPNFPSLLPAILRSGVVPPSHMTTRNYAAACEAARSLFADDPGANV